MNECSIPTTFTGYEGEKFSMAEIKSWIQEAAERAARQTAELNKAVFLLELEKTRNASEKRMAEYEKRMTEHFDNRMAEQDKKWCDNMQPHEHIAHHAEIRTYLEARRSIYQKALVKVGSAILFLAFIGAIALYGPSITLSNQKEAKTKISPDVTKIE